MPKLTIDNANVEVPWGTTVLNAARTAGIRIPSLFTSKACMSSVAAVYAWWRSRAPAPSLLPAPCRSPRNEGSHEYAESTRRPPHGGRAAPFRPWRRLPDLCASNDCELQAVARDLDVRELHFTGEQHQRLVDTSTPALDRDSSKCIMCRRCITVCSEIQATRALWAQDRGFESVAAPAFGHDLASVACVQCGQCARSVPPAPSPRRTTSTGCGPP